jgi:hypothetical protein
LLDLMTINYDICNFNRVVVSSTYLESGDFTCILNISPPAGILDYV